MGCGSGHVVGPDGQCRDCGEVVGRFDVVSAGRWLREGHVVRAVSWPPGQVMRLEDGELVLLAGGVRRPERVVLLDAPAVLGLWEIVRCS